VAEEAALKMDLKEETAVERFWVWVGWEGRGEGRESVRREGREGFEKEEEER